MKNTSSPSGKLHDLLDVIQSQNQGAHPIASLNSRIEKVKGSKRGGEILSVSLQIGKELRSNIHFALDLESGKHSIDKKETSQHLLKPLKDSASKISKEVRSIAQTLLNTYQKTGLDFIDYENEAKESEGLTLGIYHPKENNTEKEKRVSIKLREKLIEKIRKKEKAPNLNLDLYMSTFKEIKELNKSLDDQLSKLNSKTLGNFQKGISEADTLLSKIEKNQSGFLGLDTLNVILGKNEAQKKHHKVMQFIAGDGILLSILRHNAKNRKKKIIRACNDWHGEINDIIIKLEEDVHELRGYILSKFNDKYGIDSKVEILDKKKLTKALKSVSEKLDALLMKNYEDNINTPYNNLLDKNKALLEKTIDDSMDYVIEDCR